MPVPYRRLGLVALLGGALVLPLAFVLDRTCAEDVRMVAAADPADVETNRGLWELEDSPKDKVAEIYGAPAKAMRRIVFPDRARILRPKEDPTLVLYLNRGSDHPLQMQTVWYLAFPLAVIGVTAGAVLLFLGRRRSRDLPAAVPAA